MALGSTQSLTEMSTRSISWGKGGRCVRLTTLPPSCAVVMKSENLNFLEPSGPLEACNRTALPFHMFSTAYRIDAKRDYQFSMALLRFFTGPGASNESIKHFKIYDHFLKSPSLGNKSINKQEVTPCKNTKMKFYC